MRPLFWRMDILGFKLVIMLLVNFTSHFGVTLGGSVGAEGIISMGLDS
jgi:hypothetical protein